MSLFIIVRKSCEHLSSGIFRNILQHTSYPKTVNKCVQNRSFFTFFKRTKLRDIKINDNIPDEYKLIYRSTLERYLILGQVATTLTAFTAGVMLVAKLNQESVQLEDSERHERMKPLYNKARPVDNEIYVYFTVLVGIILSIQVISGKAPVRIYNYPRREEYVMIFNGTLPFTKRKLVCKAGEVFHIPQNSYMPWKESLYEIYRKQEIILMEDSFKRPADLHVMMGIQRGEEKQN